MSRFQLGEFEQRVLVAVLRCGDDPSAVEVRRALERLLDREVSRGAFYTTLERLEAKGLLTWHLRQRRSGAESPERVLEVTREGMSELKVARKAALDLWRGLEPLFEPAKP
jgi:PadR family transcriptional regulator PadR